jgi:hypothetical protein
MHKYNSLNLNLKSGLADPDYQQFLLEQQQGANAVVDSKSTESVEKDSANSTSKSANVAPIIAFLREKAASKAAVRGI